MTNYRIEYKNYYTGFEVLNLTLSTKDINEVKDMARFYLHRQHVTFKNDSLTVYTM